MLAGLRGAIPSFVYLVLLSRAFALRQPDALKKVGEQYLKQVKDQYWQAAEAGKLPVGLTPFYIVEAEHGVCKVGAEKACRLSELPQDSITMVYPGGKSRCMFSEKKEYAFQVVPRHTDKLLLHFEGGGACWDKMSTSAKACYIQYPKARLLYGHFDRQAANNPYRDHTLVYLSSCSGDLYAGNVTRDYPDPTGEPVQQRGYNNVRATIDWVQEQFGMEPLSSLVITGESAGSIGLQVWAHTLLSELKYKKASVIADSYAGVFPPGFQGPVFKHLEVCETDLIAFDESLQDKCKAGTLSFQEVFEGAIHDFPEVNFGSIIGKYDKTQIGYYDMTALTIGKPTLLSADRFHQLAESTLARYSKYPNHAHFLLSSGWHVYLYLLYHWYGKSSEDAFTGGPASQVKKHLETWMGHLAAHDGMAGRYCELLWDPNVMAFKGIKGVRDSCAENLGSTIL